MRHPGDDELGERSVDGETAVAAVQAACNTSAKPNAEWKRGFRGNRRDAEGRLRFERAGCGARDVKGMSEMTSARDETGQERQGQDVLCSMPLRQGSQSWHE